MKRTTTVRITAAAGVLLAAGTATACSGTKTVTVPGPTVTRTVPGPTVTRTVPGPTVTRTVPGPTVTRTVPAPAAKPAPSDPAAGSGTPGSTVTFVAYGSCNPDITYGSSGSTSTGYTGMHKTQDIPSPAPLYYSISAQCQQAGSASVLIRVNGVQLSSGVANGAYNIASAQVGQNPVTGQWADEN